MNLLPDDMKNAKLAELELAVAERDERIQDLECYKEDFFRFTSEIIRRFDETGWKIKDVDAWGINATQYEVDKPSVERVRIWTPVWGEWSGNSKKAMALVVCALGQAEEEKLEAQTQEDGR